MSDRTSRLPRHAGGETPPPGFTLVEMLVVILVIALLSMLVFKLVRPVMTTAGTAETVAKLEKLNNCLAEFYAEYGQYPPVPVYNGSQPVRYEYPWDRGAQPGLHQSILGDDPSWGQAPVFTFGLMSFLVPRYDTASEHYDYASGAADLTSVEQWKGYNKLYGDTRGDLERDKNACERWKPYLEGIVENWRTDQKSFKDAAGLAKSVYTNWYSEVDDAWDHDLRYESKPPYQTYKLWSVGPDGKDGTDDDIHKDRTH